LIGEQLIGDGPVAALARLAVELGVLTGLWRLAGRAVRRWAGTLPPLDRLLATAVLAAAGAISALQAFGFAGALRAGLGVCLAAAIWGWWRPATGEAPALGVRSLGPGAVPGALALGGLVPATLALGALAVQLGRALATVPVEWDGLTYHLFFPAQYLQRGALVALDLGRPIDQATFYPQNAELLFVLLMAFVRSDLFVAAAMVAWTGLAGLATGRLAHALGASPTAAAVAGALLATLPALLARAASSYVEPLLTFGLVSAVLFAKRALEAESAGERTATAALAGLALGLALGTKLTALPWLAAIGLGVVAGLAPRRSGPARGAALAAFAAGAGLPAAGWLARNALVAGNPIYPAPLLGLPFLERIDLRWHGSSAWAMRQRLAEMDLFGDALFGLPPDRQPAMTLGPLALAALILSGVTLGWIVPGMRDELRAGRPARAAALALAPLALVAGILGWLATPFWFNIGLFRSLVRTAAPTAALAFALAARVLDHPRVPAAAVALGGAAGVAAQVARAGILRGLDLGTVAFGLTAVALGGVAASAGGGRRGRQAIALVALLALLAIAGGYREARREATWLAPSPQNRFARAALAAERLAPGAATVLFASDLNFEFLYLFQGRRLERRVDFLDRRSFATGDAWLVAARATGADLLIASRWLAPDPRWPPEAGWAAEAALPLAWESEDVRIYRLAAPAPDGL